jgi:hypothetical protein
MILDEIDLRMRGSVQAEISVVMCAVASCRKMAAAVLSLRYPDGRTDVYGLCPGHLREMRGRHPSKLERETKQGAFFYAGS